MRILFVDTYYPQFLKQFYHDTKGLKQQPYSKQVDELLAANFGTSDFYSYFLNQMGWQAKDLIVNCVPLQKSWANQNDVEFHAWAMKVPHRLYRLPIIGPQLSNLQGLSNVALAQVLEYKPDIVYCQDLSFFSPEALKTIKENVRLIVGQIACPPPPDAFLKGYDLILTSFPHFVGRFKEKGIASEYFRIGFDHRLLDQLKDVKKTIPASFVGGFSRHHTKAIPLFEYLAEKTPIQFYGYGAKSLNADSPIVKNHHGEVWGMDMYRALAASRITLNRHINVAENFANNMRLYEATGSGALLITDMKDNLADIFEIGKEVVCYTSQEEAVELINYYLDHPDEAESIAKAGQARTLKDHTYQKRMEELVPLLQKYL